VLRVRTAMLRSEDDAIARGVFDPDATLGIGSFIESLMANFLLKELMLLKEGSYQASKQGSFSSNRLEQISGSTKVDPEHLEATRGLKQSSNVAEQ